MFKGVISLSELKSAIEDLFDAKHKRADFKKLISILESVEALRRGSTWLCRHPSTLRIERKEGSYIKLPEYYPKIISTGREPIVSEEINDEWISVATGSEDVSFQVMRKNQYEEHLFNCEDERFELDMAINSYDASIQLLEEVREATTSAGKGYHFDRTRHSAIKLKSIYDTYGEVAEGMLENLAVQPLRTAEFMLKRLGGYRESCALQRQQLNEVWKEVCEANFYKSLDHKSFYFRQSEKKHINTKGKLSGKFSLFKCHKETIRGEVQLLHPHWNKEGRHQPHSVLCQSFCCALRSVLTPACKRRSHPLAYRRV
eukprot:TRINITY_DN7838_c0_g5_i2.p2 TRINITY_DN7838_c0_g5~~TRINITY_DN7838_c0_g5_i2.p2  ORF type:complete len:315 (+),score=33.86 TRINITY_DN7838_c0_g5_i2:104-1048(+)